MHRVFAHGPQEGEQKGEQKGKAGALLLQLERRCGKLPRKLRDRITPADSATLDNWFCEFVTAPDLKSIFGS